MKATCIRSAGFRAALLAAAACSLASIGPARGAEPQQPVGFVALVRAPAQIARGEQAIDCRIGDPVLQGDVLQTGKRGRLKVLLSDDSVIALGSRSRLAVSSHLFAPGSGRRSTRLDLLGGRVRALVHRAVAGEKADFELRCGTAIAGVRGTEFALLADEPDALRLVAFSGEVAWRGAGGGKALRVAAGYGSRVGADGRIEPSRALAAAELQAIRRSTDAAQPAEALAWNLPLDRAGAAPPAQVDAGIVQRRDVSSPQEPIRSSGDAFGGFLDPGEMDLQGADGEWRSGFEAATGGGFQLTIRLGD
ncbi:MAG: FecR domain-containing protein [Deltaproteobacteria bacterium]|nr:FecR domain-containing protein [Deltaproteobacteria bacterium]